MFTCSWVILFFLLVEGLDLSFACESKYIKPNHHLADVYTTNIQNKCLLVYAVLESLGKCDLFRKALTIIIATVLDRM